MEILRNDWQILADLGTWGQGFHILPTCMEDLPPGSDRSDPWARTIGPDKAGKDPCLDGAGSHHLKESLHMDSGQWYNMD
jgi:hypothetical protein